ncbi:hypothetical protein Hypma_010503 [Hypsizygus marmoreus]|uniref:Transcription regulator Rua1 C-terminal domain-containing protein n=1 Tax=Hypsizygus marmoreus TaxID=39966 RepID=A0A369JUG1_HYPMA|nr:hypothetical protein Hypma_010503 [Hypsizygus marmoreus]
MSGEGRGGEEAVACNEVFCFQVGFPMHNMIPCLIRHVGISASTGMPYSPPIAFRTTPRDNPGKNERTEMREALCHKCTKWVAVEGIKAVESKVKEIFWWKHAAVCHQNSTIEDEGEVYEKDEVYERLVSLVQTDA